MGKNLIAWESLGQALGGGAGAAQGALSRLLSPGLSGFRQEAGLRPASFLSFHILFFIFLCFPLSHPDNDFFPLISCLPRADS